MQVEPFRIEVPEAQLEDLRSRLARSRLPSQVADAGWDYGANLGYLRELRDYWLEAYDWRAHEAELNRWPQFLADIDGCKLHYLHVRAAREDALTLVLTHGWPGSVYEFHKVIEPLTHPEQHGGDARDAFHVLVPSLTGYGWSEPWPARGCDIRMVAERQVKLLRGLGIARYGVQGGDWGGLVSPYMALIDPAAVLGVHLNMCSTASTDDAEEARAQGVMPGRSSISREYYFEHRGYAVIQSLKPDQLAYALNDSPLGLAAWIVQSFYAWSDIAGNLESRFSKDELITNIMIYWLTESMPSAMRLYKESMLTRRFGPPEAYVATPTAVALFKDIPRPKRAWAEKLYNIARWTEMPSGGHFAALEEPALLVDDIRAFFRTLR
ncbi:MAG: epoxide hydrolase family protein [Gammaproteobacteria bacterium]